MTSPRGTPLDLQALEALAIQVTEFAVHGRNNREQDLEWCLHVRDALRTTVAHVRALRAALEPFARAARMDRLIHVCGAPAAAELLADNTLGLEVTVGDLRRAADVLHDVTDG